MTETASYTHAANITPTAMGMANGPAGGATPEVDYGKRYVDSSKKPRRNKPEMMLATAVTVPAELTPQRVRRDGPYQQRKKDVQILQSSGAFWDEISLKL